jgi:hypothetical protein
VSSHHTPLSVLTFCQSLPNEEIKVQLSSVTDLYKLLTWSKMQKYIKPVRVHSSLGRKGSAFSEKFGQKCISS